MEDCLITFNSTTAALRANEALTKSGFDTEVKPIPFELSDTCYGLGVSVSKLEKNEAESMKEKLRQEGIDIKRIWRDSMGRYVLSWEGTKQGEE